MNFGQAVSTCMRKYGSFSGRASRSEYWWGCLFFLSMFFVYHSVVKHYIGGPIVETLTFTFGRVIAQLVDAILVLVFFIPVIAAGSRRLHDIGKSGWWQLLFLIPIYGQWLLIFLLAKKPKQEGDKDKSIEFKFKARW